MQFIFLVGPNFFDSRGRRYDPSTNIAPVGGSGRTGVCQVPWQRGSEAKIKPPAEAVELHPS